MTAADWTTSTDSMEMLRTLGVDQGEHKVLRLTIACLYRLGKDFPRACRKWVELAEQVVDGNAEVDGLDDYYEEAETALYVLASRASPEGNGAAYAVLNVFAGACWWDELEEGNAGWLAKREEQAALVREVFGNPFRPTVITPSVLVWQDRTVIRLAEAISDGGRFEELPILADALEEAGVEDATILEHLRNPGPHAVGCWALDAVLGKR